MHFRVVSHLNKILKENGQYGEFSVNLHETWNPSSLLEISTLSEVLTQIRALTNEGNATG